jgi:hypothetical protein
MPEITIKKDDFKFGAAGDGALQININVPNLAERIEPDDGNLLNVNFQIGAGKTFALGSPASVKLGFDAGAQASLTPLWSVSSAARLKALNDFGLSGYFANDQHKDRVLLVFRTGANVNATAGAKFRHSILTASATLTAGADAGYAMVRSAPIDTPADELMRDFFGAVRLPADVNAPLANDEVIVFEYGGRLNFKAGLGVGYEISGSPSFEIGQLQLAEKFDFSLLAKLNFGAQLAGRFRVTVREGAEPGWARVTVHKSRSKDFSLGAVVDARLDLETEGWPASANEFLSSVIGLKSKNWLNLFEQIAELTDFNSLEKFVDKLAKKFIEEYTGKTFDTLIDKTQFDEVMSHIRRVTQAYRNLGNHAVTLFDRYFDPVKGAIDGRLTAALKAIEKATTWADLKGQIKITTDDVLWDALQQLTDGDPLGWMLGEADVEGERIDSFEELKRRADRALQLIQDGAHEEIRRLIELAKESFPLDGFIEKLDQVTDLAALEAKANEKLAGFAERLIGKTIEELKASDPGKVISRIHETLGAIQKFRDTLFKKVTETLAQSFQFQLQAAYSRSSESGALVDFELDLNEEVGRRLMNGAGHGRFDEVLAEFNSGAVKLREGALTHRVTRESRLSVNIVGWHNKWHYAGIDRLIVEADQRIQAGGDGHLTVITTFDLEKERERKRKGERVYTNLLLRFIGESHGKIEFDRSNQMYLIEAITRMSARYKLTLDDQKTKPDELVKYLSFAAEFGLAESGEDAFEKLKAVLPTDGEGNFGAVSLAYDARFSEKGLKALLNPQFFQGGKFKPEVDSELRRTMRLIALINYQRPKKPSFENIGWAYWTPGVRKLRDEEGPNFRKRLSPRVLSPIFASPLSHLETPAEVALKPEQFIILDTLYNIEDSLIEAMAQLSELLRQSGKLKPKEFEDALSDFGKALKNYDDFDEGDNTLFAIFDKLIHLAGGEEKNSSLTLIAKLDGHEVRQTLVA